MSAVAGHLVGHVDREAAAGRVLAPRAGQVDIGEKAKALFEASADPNVADREKNRSLVLARGAMALTLLFIVLTVVEPA